MAALHLWVNFVSFLVVCDKRGMTEFATFGMILDTSSDF